MQDPFPCLVCRKGPNAAKHWYLSDEKPTKGEQIHEKFFDVALDEVSSVDDIYTILECIRHDPRVYVVRGDLLPDLKEPTQRNHESIIDTPLHWLPIDVDSVQPPNGYDFTHHTEACIEYVVSLLPEEFHNVSYVWQASGSAGFKPGIRARLWFWLARPIDSAECKAFALSNPDFVDKNLYSRSQPIYTADPVLVGLPDPLTGHRLGLVRKTHDVVNNTSKYEVPEDYTPQVIERCEARLKKSCKRVKTATEGDRNKTLNREAYYLGMITHVLGHDTVREALLEATQGADDVLPTEEAERTVDSGLAAGAKDPVFKRTGWRSRILYSENESTPKVCPANVMTAFEGELTGLFSFNSRFMKVLINSPPPWNRQGKDYPRPWRDSDADWAVKWLSRLKPPIIGHAPQIPNIAKALAEKEDAFDPFVDYLEGLPVWDGIERLEKLVEILFDDVQGAPIYRVFFRKWMVSAVARALDPGCKVDTMLVLVGKQGLGKSSFFRELMPESNLYVGKIPKGDKDQLLALQGPVIVEDGELEGYSKKEVTSIKSFITEQSDLFRPPYGRITDHHPRKCVLAGTTNERAFLHDATGGRRFWPIPVKHQINFTTLGGVRDDLWAEALFRYKAGEQWWLADDEELYAEEIQEAHRERDPFEEQLEHRFEEKFTVGDHLHIRPEQLDSEGRFIKITISQALKILNIENSNRTHTQYVIRALTALGWQYDGRRRNRGQRESWYVKI